jgi:hypothetical protein
MMALVSNKSLIFATYLSQNQGFIIGNTHFTKIVRIANIIISQITQPGKFSGVSTIIIDISESYKKTYKDV